MPEVAGSSPVDRATSPIPPGRLRGWRARSYLLALDTMAFGPMWGNASLRLQKRMRAIKGATS